MADTENLEDSSSSDTTSVASSSHGDNLPRVENVTETFFGKARPIANLNKKEWLFLVFSSVALIAAVALAIYKSVDISRLQNTTITDEGDFVFSFVIMVNACFCFFYLFHGVFRERPYELVVLLISTIIMFVYVVANFVATEGYKDNLKIGRLVSIVVLSPILIILGIILVLKYSSSGALVYRVVGADADLQKFCKTVHLCESLLRLDAQLEISMVILILKGPDLHGVGLKETLVLSIGLPFSVLWISLGFIVIVFELRMAAWFFFATGVLEPTYVVYRIVKQIQTLSNSEQEVTLPVVILVAGVVALAVRVVLLVVAALVYKNFGKGLKDKLVPKWTRKSPFSTVLFSDTSLPDAARGDMRTSTTPRLSDSQTAAQNRPPSLPRDPVTALS